MTRKHYSIDQLATATTRQAQSEAAMTRRDLNRLRDGIAGLNRTLKVLNPVKRGRTKRTTTTSPWGGIAGMALAELIDNGFFGDLNVQASGSVKIGKGTYSLSASSSSNGGYDDGGDSSGRSYTSSAQSSSAALELLANGQRIR